MMSTGSPGVRRMKKNTTMATPNTIGIVARMRSRILTALTSHALLFERVPKSPGLCDQPGRLVTEPFRTISCRDIILRCQADVVQVDTAVCGRLPVHHPIGGRLSLIRQDQ